MITSDALRILITHWREDVGSTYRTWFLWEERLKNFRSIRRGLTVVVTDIERGTFGTAYRGSSLETVVHSTSIYSGIMRMLDLALGAGGESVKGLFLVAPDNREEDVRAQLNRPAFHRVSDLHIRYLPYGELEKHRESIARFGEGLKAIHAVSKALV